MNIPVINSHLDWDNVFEFPYLVNLFKLDSKVLFSMLKPTIKKENHLLNGLLNLKEVHIHIVINMEKLKHIHILVLIQHVITQKWVVQFI